MTEAEVRAKMAEFKVEHPDVDWNVYAVYASVNSETGELDKIGYARKDRIMSIVQTPEVNR